jgi:hypothetical protein
MVVNPLERIVEMHDASCGAPLGEDAVIEHAALPGFRYAVRDRRPMTALVLGILAVAMEVTAGAEYSRRRSVRSPGGGR